MYIIIFFAFVVMCHIYYGADLTTFGTIMNSLKTLFLMLLGDLGYLDDMIVLNKVLSFFFFIAFMTSMQFILVNMFIAFISNAYTEVKKEDEQHKQQPSSEILKEKHWLVQVEEKLRKCRGKRERKKKKANETEPRTPATEQVLPKKQASGENSKDEPVDPKQVSLEDKDTNKAPSSKGGRSESFNLDSSSRLDEHDDVDDDALDEDAAANQEKSKLKQEQEQAKNKLLQMNWNKDFPLDDFLLEDNVLLPELLSEKQELRGQKEREIKCGKIMWQSIFFTLYAALYINLILIQLDVDRNYMYNTALKTVVESGKFDNTKNIYEVRRYEDLFKWFNEGFGYIAREETQQESGFTGYYIQTVNYILGGKFRLCFRLGKQVPEVDAGHFQPTYYKTFNKKDEMTADFVGESSGTQY